MKSLLPMIYYLLSRALIVLSHVFTLWHRRSHQFTKLSSRIVIEAGEIGWTSIEFKELHQSAREYLGEDSVLRLVVDRNMVYQRQVNRLLSMNTDVTHYLYDPRTARAQDQQNLWNVLKDSVLMSLILFRYGVTPVVLITDIGYRYWRYQAAAVSAQTGVVVSFMSSKFSRAMFPHSRLIGPSIFPMSQETLYYLMDLRKTLEAEGKIEKKVRFTGSLYEPRASFMRELERLMGAKADIRGRELGSVRKTDTEYWQLIASAAIVITTADQIDQPGRDLTHVQQMVYRYVEVLACGSLLLAPAVPGVMNYFTPGIHFVPFESVQDAHDKAVYYLEANEQANRIRLEGQRRAKALIESRVFWLQINAALGPKGFF
jgi:hypothetical protein